MERLINRVIIDLSIDPTRVTTSSGENAMSMSCELNSQKKNPYRTMAGVLFIRVHLQFLYSPRVKAFRILCAQF